MGRALRALGGAGLLAASLASAGPAAAVTDARDLAAMQDALNDLLSFAAPGRAVRYESAPTGNAGGITALQSVGVGTAECWDYERSFERAGREVFVDGTACELEPGLWQIQHEAERPSAAPQVALPQDSGAPIASQSASASASPQPAAPAVQTAAAYDRAMVREAQQILTELGYRPGPVDGLFGSKTGAAITAYQRDTGLAQTGTPSAALLDQLRANRQAAAGPAPQPAAASQPASAQPASASPPSGGSQATSGSGPLVVPPPPPPPPVPQ